MLKCFITVEICLLKHNCIGQSSYHKTKKKLLISSQKPQATEPSFCVFCSSFKKNPFGSKSKLFREANQTKK